MHKQRRMKRRRNALYPKRQSCSESLGALKGMTRESHLRAPASVLSIMTASMTAPEIGDSVRDGQLQVGDHVFDQI